MCQLLMIRQSATPSNRTQAAAMPRERYTMIRTNALQPCIKGDLCQSVNSSRGPGVSLRSATTKTRGIFLRNANSHDDHSKWLFPAGACAKE